jgi:AbrB family looped-hinge helix DNA binding protein
MTVQRRATVLEDMTVKEFESRVGQKGQITLPAEMRHRLGIKPRDIVRIVPVEDGVKIERAESKLLKGFGAVTPHTRPEDWRAIREEV